MFQVKPQQQKPLSDSTSVKIIAPLTSEGYLWAPVLMPTPQKQFLFKFDYSYHSFNYAWDNVDASSYLLVLSGEYTLLEKMTLGLDIPLLVISDVSSESVDDTSVDFGNIRIHVRYPLLQRQEIGFVLTPAFRLWLPTNTFLTVEGVPFVGELDMIKTFAVFEPIILIGLRIDPISIVFETGLKFCVVDDWDDFTFWSFNLVVGSAPIPKLKDLELVLELNMMVELDEDDAPSASSVDRVLPIAISTGARYRFDPFWVELALRFGLNDAEFYYGDFNVGILFGYIPNF